MFRILCLSVGFLLSLVCSVFSEPCTEYTVITDDTRATNAELDWTTTNPYTDDRLHKKWYRIQNNVGEEIATSPPGVFMCTTWYPIWMNGSLPMAENTTVTRNVCLQTFTSLCKRSWTIRIKRCPGSFLVYELEPSPVIDSGYCFGWAEPCEEGYSSETGLSPGCSSDYPHLNIEPEVQPKLVEGREMQPGSGPSLVPMFACYASNINTAYVYDIYWYINDYRVISHRNKTFTDLITTHLHPKDWVGSYALNMEVKCSIRVRNSKNTTPSPHHYSIPYTAGIIVENQTVTVAEGQETVIKLRSTIPVGCISRQLQPYCNLTLLIEQSSEPANQNVCMNNVQNGNVAFKGHNCGIHIPSTNWNHELDVKFAGYADNRYNIENPRVSNLHFKVLKFHGIPGIQTKLPVIKIHTIDEDVKMSGKACMSFAGSSFVTTDGQLFSFLGGGEFVLFKHKTLPVSVHLLQTACGLNAICSCGIAIRSYNSLFAYRTCNKITQQYSVPEVTIPVTNISKCSERDMIIVKTTTGYKITLPTGTQISYRTNNKWVQNVYVKPSILDAEKTEGLCGHQSYNGDISDDFRSRNGDTSTDILMFAKSWRVFDINEQLFIQYPSKHMYPQPADTFCTCRLPPASPCHTCNLTHPVQIGPCGLNDLSPGHVKGLKCDATNCQTQTDDVTVVIPLTYDVSFDPDFLPDPVWSNGWNEASARNICETFILRIVSVPMCEKYAKLQRSIFVNGCINQIKATGNDNFIEWLTGSIQDYCYGEFSRNESVLAMNSGAIFGNMLDKMCPNDCSGHGTCKRGRCHCSDGYVGRACAWNKSDPPRNILVPDKGLCKKRQRTCKQTNVFGNFQNSSIYCWLQYFAITENGKEDGMQQILSNAEYKNDYTVSCSFPSKRKKRSTDILAEGYHISLSYDGSHFGDTVSVITYDDNCVECNEIEFTCQLLSRCKTTTIATTVRRIDNHDDDDDSGSNENDDDDDHGNEKDKKKEDGPAVSAIVGILALLCAIMIFVIGYVVWRKSCRSKQRENKLAIYTQNFETNHQNQNNKDFNADIFTTSGIYPDESPPPYSSRRESMCSQLSTYNGWTVNRNMTPSSPPPYSSRRPSLNSQSSRCNDRTTETSLPPTSWFGAVR